MSAYGNAVIKRSMEELIVELPRALARIRAVTLKDSLASKEMEATMIALSFRDPGSFEPK